MSMTDCSRQRKRLFLADEFRGLTDEDFVTFAASGPIYHMAVKYTKAQEDGVKEECSLSRPL